MTVEPPNLHRLDHRTWPEVKTFVEENAVVVLPIGAIEQHGHQLPIDTDAYLAHRLALDGAAGRNVVVAPPITYGCRSRPQSGGGEQFPGTISLAGKTFMDLVSDVLDAFLRHGFRRVLLFSWHMENRVFTYEAAYLSSQRCLEAKIVVMEEPFDSLSDGVMASLFPGGRFPGWPLEHAGVLETSLMSYLRPDLVRPTLTPGDRIATTPYDVLPEPAVTPERSGVLWDTDGASAENGELAHREIVTRLQSVLDREFGGEGCE